MSVGMGVDVHRLVEGRKLILGGVEIPYHLGLLGHSDADVLTHAIMDALLGAAALRDIGYHFPDTDEAYRGIDSLKLLSKVKELVEAKGYSLINLDCTVIAQRPKLNPHFPAMVEKLCGVLGCKEEQINLKATTTEGMGFTGTGDGICAMAVCQLERSHE
ncbi:MAG: 2-C-methyl-D-erythritol 2,4-cyclodiphosphate synthase [Clostridiales bacterium]|nr:2-C-methyl-D-erythritol 2,4-cyclodiphosphate synthase [Clostridiales bacterium]